MVAKQIAVARKTAKGKLSYRYNFTIFTYNNQTGFRLANGKLYLSKIGSIKVVLHRQPVNIKQVTVCQKNGKWYAIVACELLSLCSTIIYRRPVGIDVGIGKFAHDSDDHTVENPQFLSKMLKPVKRAHRRLSRKKVGSSNRRKARHMLAPACMSV